MRIVLIAAISVDGKIAEKKEQSSLDWTSREDVQFFIRKTKELGTVVMGRKTFETIGHALRDRRTIVMTHHIPEQTVPGVEWTNESLSTLVHRLEKEGVASLAVIGGSTVYSEFLNAGLIQELYLTVEPILFGSGVPLASETGRIHLELLETELLGSGSVLF